MGPLMDRGLIWPAENPLWGEQLPELLITTGRRAAAVGKFIKQQLAGKGHLCKHIQILNPKDQASHYDLLLTPEHDQVQGPNTCSFRGSLHPYDRDWHNNQSTHEAPEPPFISLLLGNPGNWYWNGPFSNELKQIREAFPDDPLFFCGSPRLSRHQQAHISQLMQPSDASWFSADDGPNPYLQLLAHSKKLFVTADSINMMNECLSCPTPRSLLAVQRLPSARHQRFVNANQHQFSAHADLQPDTALEDPVSQLLSQTLLQELIRQAKKSS
jgi:mitochondrial fission protein ELM1